MLKTAANPGGTPIDAFDAIRAGCPIGSGYSSPIAGVWKGPATMSIPPPLVSNATPFFEHSELEPIDAQTNGPQLFYGLRYHTHIVKPGDHTDRNTLTLVASPTPNPLARAT